MKYKMNKPRKLSDSLLNAVEHTVDAGALRNYFKIVHLKIIFRQLS